MPIQYGSPSLQGLGQGSFASAFLQRPAAAKQKPKPVVKKAGPAPVSQTLAQVAAQRAQAQIGPQVAAQNVFNQQQNQAIQGFAQALLGKLQPVAGQVGADYDAAIQQQGGLSGQAASFLSAANPTGQVQQLLQSANAPQAQQDQIAGNLGQTFGGGAGVLAFTGGAIPGGQLAAEKAAAQSQAAQLPGLAALKGQQDLSSALMEQGQARRELEATRPALYQAAAQDIRQNNAARAKAAQTARQDQIGNRFKAAGLNEKAHEFDVTTSDKRTQFEATQRSKQAATDFLNWYKTQGLTLDETKINQKAAEFGVTSAQKDRALAISGQNANTSAVRASNSQTAADARLELSKAKVTGIYRGNLVPGFKYNAKGKVIKTSSVNKPGGLTEGQWTTAYGKVNKMADDFYHGVPEVRDSSGQVTKAGADPVFYQDAYKKLKALYPKMPTAKVREILNLYYQPGEGGRPYAVVKSGGALGIQGQAAGS